MFSYFIVNVILLLFILWELEIIINDKEEQSRVEINGSKL
jgi:hypothetical protein